MFIVKSMALRSKACKSIRQGSMSIKDYWLEFVMQYDLNECTIVRFIGGLKFEIANFVKP